MAITPEERAQLARENGKKGGRPPGALNAKTITRERMINAFRDALTRRYAGDAKATEKFFKGLDRLLYEELSPFAYKEVIERILGKTTEEHSFKFPQLDELSNALQQMADLKLKRYKEKEKQPDVPSNES